MTLLLVDSLPSTVTIGGREYTIRTDFRTGVQFEALVYDDTPESEKVPAAIALYFDETPDEPVHLVIDAILEFYRCGKPELDGGSSTQCYSFAYDWDSIYASFLSAYGIDLLDPETRIHWYKFRAMLLALPKDSALMEIIGYRVSKPTKDMSRDYKQHLMRMKKLHALPSKRSLRRVLTEEDYRARLDHIRAVKAAEADD